MDRRKGTSAAASAHGEPAVIVTYREFSPSLELRGHVRSYFTFSPGVPAVDVSRPPVREVCFTSEDSFCSPQFADGRASLVIELGAVCDVSTGWVSDMPVQARVIGALSRVGATAGTARAEMIGVFFEPGAASALLHVPAVELADRIVDLDCLWGSNAARLGEDLAELSEVARVNRLETVLLERLGRISPPHPGIDVNGLARWIDSEPATMTVRRLADGAGVSRQHLTRVFRAATGVTPKRYCRLARFQAGLVHAGAGANVPWAEVAAELGYADQSHMIAEFRELSSLTPAMLAGQRWFHPFILEAQSRTASPVV